MWRSLVIEALSTYEKHCLTNVSSADSCCKLPVMFGKIELI